MTDAALTLAAVNALTAGNQSAFARLVGLDLAALWRRLNGHSSLTEIERRWYRVAIAHPGSIRRWLAETTVERAVPALTAEDR